MPGVPPDALAQVKRGLRGLFSRKKKNQVQPTPAPDGSTGSAAPVAAATSLPPATKADSNPPASQPATTPTPQKVEPTTPESSSRAPAIPTPSEPQLQPPADTEAIKNTNPSITIPTSADTRAPTSAVGNNGMSATSGPLDDQIVHEYSDIGKEDAGAPVSKEETAIAGKEEITAAKPVNVDAVKT